MGHGTTKILFKRPRDGTHVPLTIDNDLKSVLDRAIPRNKKNWDYLAIVAGISGTGKSTLANNTLAPYCCPWFSEKYIAFTAKQFIDITTKCPDYSSVVLDESFATLNTRMTYSPDFLQIVNHVQLIRYKRLYLFFCLPNFFDLAKGMAIFRSSHLFVPYEENEGDRGQFLAFGRNEKRRLYVMGSKFMDYQASPANFHGRFYKNALIIDENKYNEMKHQHFISQNAQFKEKVPIIRFKFDLNKVFYTLRVEEHIKVKRIGQLFNLDVSNVRKRIKEYKKGLYVPQNLVKSGGGEGEKIVNYT